MVLGHERPLGGGGEVRPSSAPQAGSLDLVDHLRGGHLHDHLAQGGVAAQGFVDVELVEVGGRKPLSEHGTADGPSLLSHSSWPSELASWVPCLPAPPAGCAG